MEKHKTVPFEITIASFGKYIEIINKITKPFMEKLPIGYKLLYRGQADKDWPILPAIARGKKRGSEVALLDYERNLIEEAKYRMPTVFNDNLLPVDLLAVLQHHGIPTRLLDISASPLVALFFACQKEPKKDGEIIVFMRNIEHNATYPLQNAIADSYKIMENRTTSLEWFFTELLRRPYAIDQYEILKAIYPTKKHQEFWIDECCSNIIFAKSKEITIRQKIQQGEYILFPNCIETALDRSRNFVNYIEPIDKNESRIKHRIIIKKSVKEDLLRCLSAFGINEGTLFSDSIETVCKQIKNDISRMVLKEV